MQEITLHGLCQDKGNYYGAALSVASSQLATELAKQKPVGPTYTAAMTPGQKNARAAREPVWHDCTGSKWI